MHGTGAHSALLLLLLRLLLLLAMVVLLLVALLLLLLVALLLVALLLLLVLLLLLLLVLLVLLVLLLLLLALLLLLLVVLLLRLLRLVVVLRWRWRRASGRCLGCRRLRGIPQTVLRPRRRHPTPSDCAPPIRCGRHERVGETRLAVAVLLFHRGARSARAPGGKVRWRAGPPQCPPEGRWPLQ